MKLFLLASCVATTATAQHKPFYHLEGSGRLNPICYETTYTDKHYREEGFAVGACSEEFNKDLGKETSKVCDGHSEINIQDCPTEVIDVVTYKLGKNTAGLRGRQLQHKTLYHLEAALEAVCYETTYIDEHMQEGGFAVGSCDETFNTVLGKDDSVVCNGHSEENLKYCPDSQVQIEVIKLGKAVEASDPPHKALHFLVAAQESICYETTYIDDHFTSEGFALGSCDESFNTVLSKDDQTVCNGHSEENVKYCPGETISIEILKLGKAASVEATDPPHKPLFYLVAEQEAVCYETTYSDDHFRENGFKPGTCDESFNTVLSKDDETVCNGHSEENVKYCPGETISIEVLKLGKA